MRLYVVLTSAVKILRNVTAGLLGSEVIHRPIKILYPRIVSGASQFHNAVQGQRVQVNAAGCDSEEWSFRRRAGSPRP